MGQLYLKGVYYDTDSQALWYLDNAGSYQEISVGGGGVTSVTYQNSAMSEAVQAFVFKDEDDNIYMVYEPIRKNIVSRQKYSYAETIDLFPFDNVAYKSNTLSDVKMVGIDVGASVMERAEMSNMVIKSDSFSKRNITSVNTGTKTFQVLGDVTADYTHAGNDYIYIQDSTGNDGFYTVTSCSFNGTHTLIVVPQDIPDSAADGFIASLLLSNINWKGNYALRTPNDAELYQTGYGCLFESMGIGSGRSTGVTSTAKPTYFDSLGASSMIAGGNIGQCSVFTCNNFKLQIIDSDLGPWQVYILNARLYLLDSTCANVSGMTINQDTNVFDCTIGLEAFLTPSGDLENQTFATFNDYTVYEITVVGTTVTATPV